MKPIGILMWEHRLIERVIGLFPEEASRITKTRRVDMAFIQTAVDFIKTYADRTHHGKEEDILFKKLAEKDLSPGLRVIMNDLVSEHVFARGVVKKLVEANERYIKGEDALGDISAQLQTLADFYPEHIRKEDKDFFHQSMAFLSREEQDRMLRDFEEFDRRMVHEKYKAIAERMSGKAIDWAPPGMIS